MAQMTAGRFYTTVMPIAGIAYLILLFVTKFNGAAVLIGALAFAVIAIGGSAMLRGRAGGRQRNRARR